jgi:hypothetical protein
LNDEILGNTIGEVFGQFPAAVFFPRGTDSRERWEFFKQSPKDGWGQAAVCCLARVNSAGPANLDAL